MIKITHFEGHLLPSLLSDRATLSALVVGQLLAIIVAFSPLNTITSWLDLSFISLFIHSIILISLTILFVVRRLITSKQLLPQLLIIVLIICSVTILVSIFAYPLVNLTHLSLQDFVLRSVLIAFIIAIIYVQFSMMHLEQSEIRHSSEKAQLDALQARIRPHFLFNSLNTLAELTQQNADEAEKGILALATLSRAALSVGQTIPLTDELKLVKDYLVIEQWRFGARLKVEWQLPHKLPNMMVPSLLIQPLVENALTHGIEQCTNGGKVIIKLEQFANHLCVVVINPFNAGAPITTSGNGIALKNIIQRLYLMYGNKACLTWQQNESSFTVSLKLPFHEGEI